MAGVIKFLSDEELAAIRKRIDSVCNSMGEHDTEAAIALGLLHMEYVRLKKALIGKDDGPKKPDQPNDYYWNMLPGMDALSASFCEHASGAHQALSNVSSYAEGY